MAGVILFGFLGCLIAGWVIGISKDDDTRTKVLAWIIAICMFTIATICLFSWKQVIQEQVVLEHYNIIQEETMTTTYKIIPNGSI